MPLDPQAQAFLSSLSLDAPIDYESLDPEAVRRGYEAMGLLQTKEPVASVEELTAPGPAGPIPIRLFRPSERRPLPCLIYFHGGGWVTGSIGTHDGTCRKIANAAGCAVASVEYRLSPEAKFPAAPEDCFAATRWIHDKAPDLGLAADRIAIGGDSAGGNLTAAVSLMLRERGGPELRLQVLLYPVINHDFDTASYLENAEGYLLSRGMMIWFWKHYLEKHEDAEHPWASPLRAESLAGVPPALVITAEFDPLRDEGEAYAEKLRQSGVSVECTRYDGMFHGFFSMADGIDKSKQALAQVASRLKEAFAG